MKKLFVALLGVGAMCMTACSASQSASESSGALKSKGYTVSVYNETETKARIQQAHYDGVKLINSLFAEKGTGDDHDFLLAFFFDSIDEASKFTSKENNYNLGLMLDYASANLGKNLEKKVGTHNNVAYCGSAAAFNIAF